MNNIRVANDNDKYIIKHLIDENISIDYFSIEKIESIISGENKFFFVYTDDDGNVIAVIYCMIDTLENALKEAYISTDNKIFSGINSSTKVLLYKTTCTDKNYRHGGILSSFMKEMDEATQGYDFEFSLVMALVYPDGSIPVKHILENDGFVKRELLKKPWNKIKSYCSYCNNEYCTCDGMLYIKEK